MILSNYFSLRIHRPTQILTYLGKVTKHDCPENILVNYAYIGFGM